MLKYLFGTKVWNFGIILNGGEDSYLLYLSLVILGIAAIAYLCGNLNTAIIITRLVYGENIREKGSGNPGMTNVMRNYGWLPALFTLLGDMAKCLIAMTVGTLGFGTTGAYIAGLFCVLGHVAPILYKFKGGKGVSSTAMVVLYINPAVFGILILIFVLIVLGTKYLSLGSVMTVLIMPLVLYRMEAWMYPEETLFNSPIKVFISLAIAFIVVFLHRENIKRVMNKTERRFSFKRTVKRSEVAAQQELYQLPEEPVEDADNGEDEEDEEWEDEEEELTEEVVARKEENRKKSKSKKK